MASCAITAGAAASDLTIKGRASETVELNDNYGLSPNPSGVLGSYSSGNFSALYRTPATRFSLDGDIVYRKYFGPGAETTSFSETTSDGLNMRFERDGKSLGDRDFIYAGRRRQDSAFAQRNDIGFSTTSIKGDLITYTAGAGGSRRLSNKDVVSLSVDTTHTTYSPSSTSTTPFTMYNGSAGWSHSATHTIDLNLASSLGLSKYDNTANTQVVSSRTTGGAVIRLSDRLRVGGNAGVAVFKTTQDTAGPVVIVPVVTDPFNTPLFTPAPAVAGTVIAPVWDANLNYQLSKDTSLIFVASQTISPGTLGDFAKRTDFTISANHSINSISALSVSAAAYLLEPPAGGTGSMTYSGTVSYSYRLARDWLATATYIYRQIQSTSSSTTTQNGTASSNALLFVISKDFVLKP